MGDAQSAQREVKKDAADEEESGKVDDAQAEQNIEDKPLKNNGQISEINGKADGSIAEVNGHREDEIAADAIPSQDEDILETEKSLKEEPQLENVEMNEKASPEADPNEDTPLEMTELDTKQNDINEGFRRFFSNIGLKLTVKRGSSEITTNVPDKANKEEPKIPEDLEDTTKETKSENAELSTDAKTAQETFDNDSTTCPTLTDVTLDDAQEKVDKETTEAKQEVKSDNADAATTSGVEEHAPQDATPEEELHSTYPSSAEEEVVISPIKRFFTTGIFSGLRKKKKTTEDETTEKELVDMGGKQVIDTTDQTVQDQQQVREEVSPDVETAAAEAEVTEPEILSSQERDKVQASPLRRLLSGSSLKKLSKKQRSRKSSDAKLSDSGEHVSDQLLSSTESAENQKEESQVQPSTDAAGDDDGAWASFKKLVTPKKLIKRSSLSNEESQIPGSVEEPRPNEGEQISDNSTEEGKKRKDSSVSWEAVLCGSGRRRSRKTSDSEDETPQIDKEPKQDGQSKHAAESPIESSNENDILASSPRQAGSPSEGDGGSTWKSLKRLVTPKRKAKEEEEPKDDIQSDSDGTLEESSFLRKKLLPGRKKRKSAEKQDQVSSDEADKDVPSGDEDSETPAVIPLSEFDTVETEAHIQTKADIESHIPNEASYELQQDLPHQVAEPVLPCDSLQTEAKEVQDNDDALEEQVSPTPLSNEEPDDLTESISKHQQLSDIPEEGIITETMVTPASVTEEAVRDDTIAEDLLEITSEAFTAPEPASDITLADETEMISAVSQLSSESSKTSGNTTPVPAEYDLVETNTLLHQVVETISMSPKAVTVFSNELNSENIVGSVSHQVLETLVKEETTVLERHRRHDATAIKTGLSVEEHDAINELTATSQTESISVNESVSTEVVSEVPTEEFNTAEVAVDEIHEASFTYLDDDDVKELERIDESHHLLESLSETNAAVSPHTLPEGEEIVLDAGSLVEEDQAETEPPKMDSKEKEEDLAATEANETKDTSMEQESQAVTEEEAQLMHNIIDQIQVEYKDQQPIEVEELQELAAVTLDSEEDSVQSPEKEVTSEDTPQVETVTDEIKEETMPVTEVNIEAEKEDELGASDAKTEHDQLPVASEDEQRSTFNSEERCVQATEEEVKSEDVPLAETVTDEPKQTAEDLTEHSVEPENKEQPVNALITEHGQEPELSEAVQADTLDSVVSSVQILQEEVISEDVPETETVKGEPKEESIPLTEVNREPMDASKTEHVQEPEPLVQAPTLDSEEVNPLSLEKEGTPEAIPVMETFTDEPKRETELNAEPEERLSIEGSITEHVQEPEPLVQAPTLDSEVSPLSLEKEETPEAIPVMETFIDQPKQETELNAEPEERISIEGSITEHVQEPEVLPSNIRDISSETKTEEQALVSVHVVTDSIDEGSAQELEKQILLDDIPKSDTNNVLDSVTDETESEDVPQLGQALDITEDQKNKSIPHSVLVEQEDIIPEAVDELQTLTAVHVSSVNETASSVQTLEQTVFSEKTIAPSAEYASVTDELTHEMHLSVMQVGVEQEKESQLPDTEVKTAAVEHPVVAQVVVCNLKDVSVAIPDVLIEETTENTEPLMDTLANELSFKEEVEAAATFVNDNVAETAEEGSVVVVMHVPSVTFEDNYRMQVQVVDVNVKSAESIVDSVLEVGVTETKEIIGICHETVKKIDNLSATPGIEEEILNEESKVTIQEVVQLVKQKLPETVPESEVVNLEQEVIKQTDTVAKVSETVGSESNEKEEQRVMEDRMGTFREQQDEAPAVISDDSATEQQVSEDHMQTPDIPGGSDVLLHDRKENSEESKAECEKSDVDIAADVKTSSEEEDVQNILEQAQVTQIVQTPIVTPSNTELSVPQNTGIISSIGNVESPSSLSLEFKLNIQFGQAKSPAPPQTTTERVAPVKQTDVSEVGVQAVEPVNPISPMQGAESQNQTELAKVPVQAVEPVNAISPMQGAESQKQTELAKVPVQAVEPVNAISPMQGAESQNQTELAMVPVQATEITEPEISTDSTEKAANTQQPVLLDVGIQAMETVEQVEQIKSTETVTSSIQVTGTIQPVRPKETREVFLSQPVLSEACDQETKAEEPVKHTGDENEQDVWMDAEEVIYTQEDSEVSLLEVEEPQIESKQEERGLCDEAEMAPNSITEEAESPQTMHMTQGRCDIESEGEDFAVALEHPETATSSITTMEWD